MNTMWENTIEILGTKYNWKLIEKIVSTKCITANCILHSYNKYIMVDYHFICELVSHDDMFVKYIPTQSHVEDIFYQNHFP